ncbi:hypothetical protein BV22DRAFT_989017, partial [Leucogyrophana mollusca]
PLPLSDTLRDLALLRASDINLSSLLSNVSSAKDQGTDNEAPADDSTKRSYEFVKEARVALRTFNGEDLTKQGARVEGVITELQEVLKGLS